MDRSLTAAASLAVSLLWAATGLAQSPPKSVASFVQQHCIACHDEDTTTELNFDRLPYNLTDRQTRLQWESVYDRLAAGEMPPESETLRPPEDQIRKSLALLNRDLREAGVNARRRHGRVPVRRLSTTEYKYSIGDLLRIDTPLAGSQLDAGHCDTFDTVGTSQGISAMHMERYLATATEAISTAINLSTNPYRNYKFDLLGNEHLNSFHEKEIRLGGNISKKLDDSVVLFRDVDYLLRSDLHGFKVRESGYYQINITAAAYQSDGPVALKVAVRDRSGQTNMAGAFDLIPGQTRELQVRAFLTRAKVFYVAMVEEQPHHEIIMNLMASDGAKAYLGKGVQIKSLRVQGPMSAQWPPESTRQILTGIDSAHDPTDSAYAEQLHAAPLEHVKQIVIRMAPRAFRRPVTEAEVESLVALAEPAFADGRPFLEAVQIPLRAMLSSPQFLLLAGEPGPLDDYSLASRLSYFLWKTLPDDELMLLAQQNRLTRPDVLTQQVDRMLDDDRSLRFVRDFLNQWLRLGELDDSAPDERLYPEYDALLHWSIPQETQSFFRELVKHDLSVDNLIDSEFIYVNRRLASHYGIHGVVGQMMQKVTLPENSPRGGILTQASVLKVTANGVVTSPVVRGNFVLSNLLGTPPPPPPPGVGFVEPDTSGASSMREQLARHRDVPGCARCHDQIDPPGFALESFDPIGGFRMKYRASVNEPYSFVTYQDGLGVDPSGITHLGQSFAGIQEFKQHLLEQRDQLARHFISQLLVYSTGGEIEFADREDIDAILARTGEKDYGVRTILQEVVQSQLFRHR